MAGTTVNPAGGSGKKERRDSACTPKWLADLIGKVGVDPCSNPRSHINAFMVCSLENGGNGLLEDDGDGVFGPGCYAGRPDWGFGELENNYSTDVATVFINPPYNRGQVIRWVRHWYHTRFIFLLRWSPDTKWFAELFPHCTHLWFPNRRIDFDPPPGVEFSSNPYPHALYLREPSAALQMRLEDAGYLVTL